MVLFTLRKYIQPHYLQTTAMQGFWELISDISITYTLQNMYLQPVYQAGTSFGNPSYLFRYSLVALKD